MAILRGEPAQVGHTLNLVQNSHQWECLTHGNFAPVRKKDSTPYGNNIQKSEARLHTAAKNKLSASGNSACARAIFISQTIKVIPLQ